MVWLLYHTGLIFSRISLVDFLGQKSRVNKKRNMQQFIQTHEFLVLTGVIIVVVSFIVLIIMQPEHRHTLETPDLPLFKNRQMRERAFSALPRQETIMIVDVVDDVPISQFYSTYLREKATIKEEECFKILGSEIKLEKGKSYNIEEIWKRVHQQEDLSE
jgi:hypothetical protein